nr:hypothetical protein [Methanobrevibacter smithii]
MAFLTNPNFGLSIRILLTNNASSELTSPVLNLKLPIASLLIKADEAES